MDLIIDEQSGTTRLPFLGGINENIRLESVEVNVNFLSEEEKKLPVEQQKTKAAIFFNFVNNLGDVDETKKRFFTHAKFEPKTQGDGTKTYNEILVRQIKHIYEVIVGNKMPSFKASSYGELFTFIGNSFNRPVTTDGVTTYNPVYKDAQGKPISLNLLVEYGQRNSLQLPAFGNFIDKYTGKGLSTIIVKPTHQITMKAANGGQALAENTNAGAEDLPF